MSAMLAVYWIKRFALVFIAVAAALLALQLLRDGVDAIDIGGIVLWSALPGLLAASVNTWWVRKRGCRLR